MDRPLLSIVIVNFNYGQYIEQAIVSILNQDFKDYELIIVDGGSLDNSVDIIRKYSDRIAWWVSEPDRGQSHAFNKGFTHANGEFLFWLNSDDIILSGKLKIIAEIIQKNKNKYLWFTANTIVIDSSNTIIKCINGIRHGKFIHHALVDVINVGGPSSIFHRNIFRDVGPFDERLHYTMDTDMWMRFAEAGHKYFKIDLYLWGFRKHKKSKTIGNIRPEEYYKELEFLSIKYNYNELGIKQIILRLYKLGSGLYLKSFIDSCKYKGKTIYHIR